MNLIGSLFTSSIGRKFLMAATGAVLFGFVIGHLAGNLQIFQHPDHINGYSQFLRNFGAWLWVVRLGLLACAAIHIWAATVLALENKRARGEPPQKKAWLRASLSSRYIRWTGYLVLAFVLYHLAHFSLGLTNPTDFKDKHSYVLQQDYRVFGFTTVKAGTEVDNVYLMVYRGFESLPVSLFYIVAVGLLSLHLLHGVESLFQTLGWRSGRWAGALDRVVVIVCLVYFLGNLAIPAAILTHQLQPNPDGQVHSPVASLNPR